MVNEFEKKTKRLFGGDLSSNAIHFGRNQDNDREYGILKGRITLTSEEIQSTFNDPITRTVDSCLKLLQGHKVQHLLLVGGFGESPFLRQRSKALFEATGTSIVTVEQSFKKAAVEGAAIWYLKKLVSGRAARFSIGLKLSTSFDDSNLEHREREALAYIATDGSKRLTRFAQLIEKNAVLQQGREIYKKVYTDWEKFPGETGKHYTGIYVWEGDGTGHWFTDREGKAYPQMRKLCTIKTELKDMVNAITTNQGSNGEFWTLAYFLVVRFGATRIQAWKEWKEGGKTHKGPATVLPGVVL